MSRSLIEWLIQNASITVALSLLLVALVIAVLGLLLAMWIKPKLTEIEVLKKEMGECRASAIRGESAANALPAMQAEAAVIAAWLQEIKSQKLSEGLTGINVRVVALEVTRAAEAALQHEKLVALEQSVARALSAMDSLQSRSEEEIITIQTQTATTIETIKKESREELIRQSTFERTRLALEQAEQDYQLALIREQLARGYEPFHSEALVRVQSAQARVEALKVQAQAVE